MILEAVTLQIKKGLSESFESDFKKAEQYISAANGYIRHTLQKCLEDTNKYLLLVEWETLKDHTVGFRGSDDYQKWKDLLHHYYDPFPVVEHFEIKNRLNLKKYFSKIEIEEICKEIELQWNCHLMTRAIFDHRFPTQDNYTSGGFYAKKGFDFGIKLPKNKNDAFNSASQYIGHWLNENFIIRLFGILDSKGLIKYGSRNNSKLISLIKALRNNCGTHSSGRVVTKQNSLNRVKNLLKEVLAVKEESINIQSFNLSINTVLEPLKDNTLKFVENLPIKDSESSSE